MTDQQTRDAELRAALDTFGDAWANFGQHHDAEVDYVAALRTTPDDVPLLVAVAHEWLRWGLPEDEQPKFAEDDVALFAPIHALRCLGQMRAAAAIEPLVAMLGPMAPLDDDVLLEEFPPALARFGAAAFEALDSVASNRALNEWSRVAAINAMEQSVKSDPALRDEVIARFRNFLERPDPDAATVNGAVIGSLVGFGDKESAPLITQAYEAGVADEDMNGSLEWVLHDLGIGEKPTTPRYQFFRREKPPIRRVDARHEQRARKKRERKARNKNRR